MTGVLLEEPLRRIELLCAVQLCCNRPVGRDGASATSEIWASDEGRRAVEACYADLLRRWPVPSEPRRLPTREGETFVLAWGRPSAPPVVMLQGSGANVAMWLPDVAAWAEHHRVYAVDVIGEPGSSAPSRPPLGSDAYALWLDDVMSALGLEHAAFVGVSLGAWIVLDYAIRGHAIRCHAIRRTGRVDKVVVISPSGLGRQRIGGLFRAAPLMLFGSWGRKKAMAMIVGPVAGPPRPFEQEVGALALLVAKHFRHRRERIPLFDDEALERLTMPVLAIVGAQDALLDSRGTRRRLEELVPTATVRWLPEAGHLVRDQMAAILGFLGG